MFQLFADSRKWRELVSAGIDGTPSGGTATLAGLCRQGTDLFWLGAAHAFTRAYQVPNAELYQLISPDSSGEPNFGKIGDLSAFSPPPKIGGGPLDGPTIDAAIARVSKRLESGLAAFNVQQVVGIPEVGMSVWKSGAVSGMTKGRIIAVGCSVYTKFGWYTDQVLVVGENPKQCFSVGGDSGSLVLDACNRAIGMVVGGPGPAYDSTGTRIDGQFSVLCSMENVCTYFDVALVS